MVHSSESHLAVGTWMCPYCSAENTLMGLEGDIQQSLSSSFFSHLLRTDDAIHGTPGYLPDDFEREDAVAYMDFESVTAGIETQPASTV
jgi:hypothetical protein